MHFTTQHISRPFAPALMVDPEFEGAVQLPDLSPPDVVEHDTDGNEHVLVALRVRRAARPDGEASTRGRQPSRESCASILTPDRSALTIEAEADSPSARRADHAHRTARVMGIPACVGSMVTSS